TDVRAGLGRGGGPERMADDVFVSVAGGLEVTEPAADLGVAAAVASSFRNRPLPARTAVFGAVGVAGGGRARGSVAWACAPEEAPPPPPCAGAGARPGVVGGGGGPCRIFFSDPAMID